MRKRILALLLAAATALGLCACAPEGDRADSGKLSVVCSLFPYYDFVRVIGGEWVEPRLLVAAGREAHSFEPTPADVIRVSRADVFVYNGGEGEQWVDEILSSAGENIPTVLRMMDYAQTLEEEPVDGDSHDDHDDHDGHDHDSDEIEYDEHIWTSPVEAEKLRRPGPRGGFSGQFGGVSDGAFRIGCGFSPSVSGEKTRSAGIRRPLSAAVFLPGIRPPLPGGLSRLLVRHGAVPLHPEISH